MTIYRRIKSVYFILLPMTNLREHNAMILAFGGCFAGSVGCDEVIVGVNEEALPRIPGETKTGSEK